MKTRFTIVLWILLAIAIAATQQSQESSGSPAPYAPASPVATTPVATGAIRTILVGTDQISAADQTLQLVRYDIEPGVKLAAHTHPGTQIAWIESGELTYTVVEGAIQIQHAGDDGAPGMLELLESGQTTVLGPGDSVIETEGMVHFGENRGSEPVVVLAATLLVSGEPPSTVHDMATPVAN